MIDPANGFAYFGTSNAPAKIVKIDLGNGPDLPTRIGSTTLASGENALQSAVIDQVDGFAYFGTMTSPGKIIKIELGTGLNPPTRIGAITLIDGEKNLTCAVIDSNSGHAYFGTNTTPGLVIRVGLSQKGFVKGTKFFLPEPGMVTDANFYSHAAAGNVRLAIYDTAPQPGLLWQSGSITNSVTEDWIRELISNGTPASLQLDAGDYWLAWQVDTSLPVPSYAQGTVGDGFYVPHSWNSFPATLDPEIDTASTLTDEIWSGYVVYDPLPTPEPPWPVLTPTHPRPTSTPTPESAWPVWTPTYPRPTSTPIPVSPFQHLNRTTPPATSTPAPGNSASSFFP